MKKNLPYVIFSKDNLNMNASLATYKEALSILQVKQNNAIMKLVHEYFDLRESTPWYRGTIPFDDIFTRVKLSLVFEFGDNCPSPNILKAMVLKLIKSSKEFKMVRGYRGGVVRIKKG